MTARYLNLILLDSTGIPLAGRPYRLEIEGDVRSGLTSEDGRFSESIPPTSARVDLTVAWRRFVLHVDALEPVTSVRGVQARLNQLNFHAGPVDGDAGPRTRGALRSFARASGGGQVTDEGPLDEALLARLDRHYHGDAPTPRARAPRTSPPLPSETVAADLPVDVQVLSCDRPDGPAITLVVYDWFSLAGEFPPEPGNAVEALVDGAAAWAREGRPPEREA